MTTVLSFPDNAVRIFTVQYNAATLGHQLVATFSHQGGELVLYGAALAGVLAPQAHMLELTDDLSAFLVQSRVEIRSFFQIATASPGI